MADTKIKTFGVTLEDTALAFSTSGVTAGKWLQQTASDAWSAIKNGVQSAIDLGKRMFEGGKEVLKAIARGDLKIFLDWFKDDPKSAIAGGAAVAVAGWFIGTAVAGSGAATAVGSAASSAYGALATATTVASTSISSMWATIGGIRFGGVALGLMLPTLQQAIVSGTNTVYNLDWQQSDASILAELESSYLSFLNNVGESTGRLLAGLALGGGKKNPKLNLNITASAALVITARQSGSEIEEELVEELTQLSNTFIRYATNLASKLGYLEIRKFARKNIRTGIRAIDNMIASWGTQEGGSWSIAQAVDKKVEEITESNAAAGNFLEGLIEGFGDGFSDFILMT